MATVKDHADVVPGDLVLTSVPAYADEWAQIGEVLQVEDGDITVKWLAGSKTTSWVPVLIGKKGNRKEWHDVISVNDIWMSKRHIELREVRQMVERAKAENPEGSVVIVADKGSRIGMVTQVMDQVRLAGVEGIALSAERKGE